MTPKQRVLKKYPSAYLFKWTAPAIRYTVKKCWYYSFAAGNTPRVAWANAAKKISAAYKENNG